MPDGERRLPGQQRLRRGNSSQGRGQVPSEAAASRAAAELDLKRAVDSVGPAFGASDDLLRLCRHDARGAWRQVLSRTLPPRCPHASGAPAAGGELVVGGHAGCFRPHRLHQVCAPSAAATADAAGWRLADHLRPLRESDDLHRRCRSLLAAMPELHGSVPEVAVLRGLLWSLHRLEYGGGCRHVAAVAGDVGVDGKVSGQALGLGRRLLRQHLLHRQRHLLGPGALREGEGEARDWRHCLLAHPAAREGQGVPHRPGLDDNIAGKLLHPGGLRDAHVVQEDGPVVGRRHLRIRHAGRLRRFALRGVAAGRAPEDPVPEELQFLPAARGGCGADLRRRLHGLSSMVGGRGAIEVRRAGGGVWQFGGRDEAAAARGAQLLAGDLLAFQAKGQPVRR
mmetsp:Transcript_92031/g.263674  ORF Transcript_92031/g.263674 Transcript_92031/m.263674 type:complete len:395 (+) Transcript_92031:128-1312(+)